MCVVCVCFTVMHDNELTHTDLKPENILFYNSECEVMYNPKKVKRLISVVRTPYYLNIFKITKEYLFLNFS